MCQDRIFVYYIVVATRRQTLALAQYLLRLQPCDSCWEKRAYIMADPEETPEVSAPTGPLSNFERVVKDVSSPATNRLTMDEVFVDGKIDLDLVCVWDTATRLFFCSNRNSDCVFGLLCRGPFHAKPSANARYWENSSRHTSTLRAVSRLKWPSASLTTHRPFCAPSLQF